MSEGSLDPRKIRTYEAGAKKTDPNTDYPNASDKAQSEAPKAKPVIKARKGDGNVGQRLIKYFFVGTLEESLNSAVQNILLPKIKQTILDAVNYSFSMLVNGTAPDTSRRGSRTDYTSFSKPSANREYHRVVNRSQPIEEMYFETKEDAYDVVDRLADAIEDNREVSLGQLYDMVEFETRPSDFEYGWYDISNVRVVNTTNGWRLDMPRLRPLK